MTNWTSLSVLAPPGLTASAGTAQENDPEMMALATAKEGFIVSNQGAARAASRLAAAARSQIP